MTTVAAKPATMAQALTRGLRDAMADDPTVHVMGEDVGTLGGVFRITDGLTARFGEERCFDTPLAESGIAGMAVGMALGGARPVIEMQFDAFAYPAFEQIASHVAKMRNRTKGATPMPIRIVPQFSPVMGASAFIAMIAMPARKAAIEPTDRSSPPWVMTKVMPTAISPMKAERASTFDRFTGARKAGFSRAPRMNSPTRATRGPRRCRSMRFMQAPPRVRGPWPGGRCFPR